MTAHYGSPVTSPPPDVIVAGTIRALTRALLAACLAAGALGVGAVAVLTLAGGSATGLAPVLSLLALGQVAALASAVVAGLGLRATLRDPAGGPPGGDATSEDAARARAARGVTARRLAVLARVTLAACVVAVAAWALVDPGAVLGALAGAVVAAQVAVLAEIVGRRLAAGGEPA